LGVLYLVFLTYALRLITALRTSLSRPALDHGWTRDDWNEIV